MLTAQEWQVAANIGGWVFAAVVLGSIIWAFVSGKLAGGGMLDHLMGLYDKLVASHEEMTTSVNKTTDALALQAQAQSQLREEVQRVDKSITDGLKEVREELRSLRGRVV